jgi:DNA-binding MarR family transcriptional regulator
MNAPLEPRWLDAKERQAWVALASTLNRLPSALDAQLRRDAGITHFEYQVLALLSEAPGRTLRMSVLATQAEGSLPRLSQVVARLEQHGWVRRTPDPGDGRYTLAILSDDGWAKATEAAPGHVEEVRRLVIAPLTKAQTRQLGEIGRRTCPLSRALSSTTRTRRSASALRYSAARSSSPSGTRSGSMPSAARKRPRTSCGDKAGLASKPRSSI